MLFTGPRSGVKNLETDGSINLSQPGGGEGGGVGRVKEIKSFDDGGQGSSIKG